MYCPECGHQNPTGNKFCGMCGERLPERTMRTENRAAKPEIRSESREIAAERRERIAEHDPEPVAANLRHREPVDETVRESELPGAVAEFYSSRPTLANPARVGHPEERLDEEPTTVSGPSFLGLSGGSGDSSSYSYLYEDEQPKSHVGSLVFVALLAILAVAIYVKWQPIRDYVVNAALTHSQSGRAPQNAAPTQPGSTTASSDNAAAQPGQTANPNGLPQQDNAATPTGQQKSDQPKTEGTPKIEEATPPAASDSDKTGTPKTSTPKGERPQSEVGRTSRFQKVKGSNASEEDTADTEKPSAQRPAKAAGTELVDTGERYLYGRGVPRNCNQALVNFQAAAKQDNAKAMSHLGSLYATGECVPLDRVQAYQWYSRALSGDRSNTYLEHNLNMLWRDMSSGERAKATQKRMF